MQRIKNTIIITIEQIRERFHYLTLDSQSGLLTYIVINIVHALLKINATSVQSQLGGDHPCFFWLLIQPETYLNLTRQNFCYFSTFFNNISCNRIYYNKISQLSSNENLLINSDGIINNCNKACLRLESDTSVDETTNVVFIVGQKIHFVHFKEISSFCWFKVEFLFFKSWYANNL